LPAGTYRLSIAGRGEDNAETGDLDIKGKFIILGAGAKSTTINGNNLDRVFDVRSGSLLLQSLTVTNGHALDEGGGIRASAPLTLNRVHLHSNTADGDGGGIAVNGNIVTNADLSVVRSTISNNRSGRTGGGLRASGFVSRVDTISIRESTISGNSITPIPNQLLTGGMDIFGAYVVNISHSTIAFNEPNSLLFVVTEGPDMDHTILANNGQQQNCAFIGSTFGARLNVDSDGSCGFLSTLGNLILVDPQLSPLADNGGQTPTHAFNNLLLGDAGDAAGATCSGIDQRGLPRPVDFDGVSGARCDIGAIELQGPVGIAVLEPDAATVRKDKPFHLSYLWRVPPDQVWRDIQTWDLRVVERDKDNKGRNHGHDDKVIFWLRWSEAANTFQLVNPRTGQPQGDAFPAGSNHVLETEDALLDVRISSSEGSGPTGQEVTLHLALIFNEKSEEDKPFTIEVTAVDDGGQTQPFLALGSVAVGPPKGH
jgi:hypothetical protein